MNGSRAREHVRSNLIGYVALFVAFTGTAYATHPGGANTISSGDIINGQVLTNDIGVGAVTVGNLATNSVSAREIIDAAVHHQEIAANAVRSRKVRDESLTGVDLNEATFATVPEAAHAADADELDGIDSAGFVQGNGTVRTFAGSPAAGAAAEVIQDPALDIDLFCSGNPPTVASVVGVAGTPASGNTFFDTGSEDPTYIAGGATAIAFLDGPGDVVTIQIQKPSRVDTVWLSYFGRPGQCHYQGIWIGAPYA